MVYGSMGKGGERIHPPYCALFHRMTNSQRLAKVRACLLQWISEHPAEQAPESSEMEPESTPSIVRESILMRNEFFCGRRFFTPEHYAIWFIEEDELKIYHQSGSLLGVLNGQEIDEAVDGSSAETSGISASPAADILKLPARDAAVATNSTAANSTDDGKSQEPVRRAA